MHPLKRLVIWILCATMLAGCSKAVELPSTEYDAASQDARARFRIQMTDGTSHNVDHFSLTDSTIVMEKRNPPDFRHKQTTETIVASREEVASIAKYELARERSFFALSGTFVAIMLILSLRELGPIE
jgi:hypothetical protein